MDHLIPAPSKTLLACEFPRGALEYLAGFLSSFSIAESCPRGDGGPILVLPGLGTTDSATSMLRRFLDDVGYAAYGWNRGRNCGPTGGVDTFVNDLVGDLERLEAHHGEPVRIIGWSLGGLYAREMAKRAPRLVRQVVTLGTPFNGIDCTHGAALFEKLSGTCLPKDAALVRRLAQPPAVPTVSVYSKTDGVVAWQASINPDLPHLENAEVVGVSHLGMVSNPVVYRMLAKKLATPAAAKCNETSRGMLQAA